MAYFRSSNTPLTKNSTWTSNTGLRERHDTVQGIAFSDQGGTLLVDQSSDGVNWDVSDSFTITGGTGKEFLVQLYGPYWRLRYTNGGTDQTAFRISATTQAGGDS